MLSCALGTTTSPFQYQSNSSAGLSSGWATKPSSDMHMWVSTWVMPVTTPLTPPTHRGSRHHGEWASGPGIALRPRRRTARDAGSRAMSYAVDFVDVSTDGLESSPVAAA